LDTPIENIIMTEDRSASATNVQTLEAARHAFQVSKERQRGSIRNYGLLILCF